jgi:hypothetical protein
LELLINSLLKKEKMVTNAQGRLEYVFNEDLRIWVKESEYEFLKYLEKRPEGWTWNQTGFSLVEQNYFAEPNLKYETALHNQNAFIKRMLKYGILKTVPVNKDRSFPNPCAIVSNKIKVPIKLHLHNGHNVEHWIRDHWDKYSAEKMEVVSVKSMFDTPDQYRMFIAHEDALHSYEIKAETDETVFECLNEIEKDLKL